MVLRAENNPSTSFLNRLGRSGLVVAAQHRHTTEYKLSIRPTVECQSYMELTIHSQWGLKPVQPATHPGISEAEEVVRL